MSSNATLAVALAAVAWSSVTASAQPVPKVGTCPTNYPTSGAYCAPNSMAGPALPRIGLCPTGYNPSGDYCLGQPGAPKAATTRVGACPTGFHVSGNYCLTNR